MLVAIVCTTVSVVLAIASAAASCAAPATPPGEAPVDVLAGAEELVVLDDDVAVGVELAPVAAGVEATEVDELVAAEGFDFDEDELPQPASITTSAEATTVI
ncbi:MAG: hypothetical protein ACYDHH_28140 [Solirubrobacteraceae bacterium]